MRRDRLNRSQETQPSFSSRVAGQSDAAVGGRVSSQGPIAGVDDLIHRFYFHVPIGQRSLEAAIREALAEGHHTAALDAGCGTDAPLTRKFSELIPTVGIDLCQGRTGDLRVVTGDLANVPFRNGSFSLVFSRSVFEHLTHPDQVLQEIHRVLRPNGVCVILTPNRFDYSSVAAAMTPQWFHEWFVKRLYRSASYDTFPTVYRANTPGFFRAIARGTTWRIKRISGVRHYPINLGFSRFLFRIGILYDWMIARIGLTALQPSLLVVLERTGS
jgi:SAM-dependent methyltransferase